MEFRKAMFGYPKEKVKSLIAGLEEEQGREEQQLAERIAAAEAELKEMEGRLQELTSLRQERQDQLKAVEERLAEQYFASIKSIHTSRYEAKEKKSALEEERSRQRTEMERVETLMLELCSQLDQLSQGFDLAMEGIGHE
ncbi:MAG: hypothetical protein VB085_02710 [Peptococcaceae bacterium]|nr:hypothetical protein [Peptococcaceae bacterium]